MENQANGGCVSQKESFLDYPFLVLDTRKTSEIDTSKIISDTCLDDFVSLQLILFDKFQPKIVITTKDLNRTLESKINSSMWYHLCFYILHPAYKLYVHTLWIYCVSGDQEFMKLNIFKILYDTIFIKR